MSYILDSCTFLWLTTNDPLLSASARTEIVDPNNAIYLSSVSVWEICVKYVLGKLPLPAAPELFIPKQRSIHRLLSLSLEEDDALLLRHLPPLHKDPFDRMLVCQAKSLDFTILTPDPLIQQYPVRVLW